jgi:hypothetical protein
MNGDARRTKLRSFALGGLVGAAGAIVTARRRAIRSRSTRTVAPGLAAFEDAPCFLEHVGEESQAQRGGDSATGVS